MASDDLKGIFFPRRRGAAQPFRGTKGKQSRDVSEVPDVKKKEKIPTDSAPPALGISVMELALLDLSAGTMLRKPSKPSEKPSTGCRWQLQASRKFGLWLLRPGAASRPAQVPGTAVAASSFSRPCCEKKINHHPFRDLSVLIVMQN